MTTMASFASGSEEPLSEQADESLRLFAYGELVCGDGGGGGTKDVNTCPWLRPEPDLILTLVRLQ